MMVLFVSVAGAAEKPAEKKSTEKATTEKAAAETKTGAAKTDEKATTEKAGAEKAAAETKTGAAKTDEKATSETKTGAAKTDEKATSETKTAEKKADKAVDTKDMVPLKVDLPKAMYVGTPKNLRSPNLEPPRKPGQLRVMPLVPPGTVNLALKKRVASSDKEPIIGEVELITDGDKNAKDGCFVEFGPGKQWVQVDLGAKCDIYVILIWHYHSEGRVYRDVIVQTADDPDFVTGVKTVFNNDHDNTAKMGAGKEKEYIENNEGKLIECKDVQARYVRLYSGGNTSNDMNHYTEVEVYGKPVGK
jgi:hypothetical protein